MGYYGLPGLIGFILVDTMIRVVYYLSAGHGNPSAFGFCAAFAPEERRVVYLGNVNDEHSLNLLCSFFLQVIWW